MPPSHSDDSAERRQAPNTSVGSKEFKRGSLDDVISTFHHSRDFIQTRNNYIVERLRLICLFFAISVPVASLLDFIVFDSKQAELLLVNRIVLSVSLLILFKVVQNVSTVSMTRIVLALSFLFPVLFYIATLLTLTATMDPKDIPLSFSLMPYLIIAMLGLFPLTISGGLALLGLITGPLVILEYLQYSGSFASLVDKVWLFILFGGISLWLQTGQLVMLMKLYRESTIDPLTGLINRRVLMRQVDVISKRCGEANDDFCVMMFDLDHFKRVNDTYGHMTGDKVLVNVATLLKRELRNSDVIARFGGEEFLVVMPHLQLDQAAHVALRIADVIRNSSVKSEDNELVTFTTSIGVTQYRQNEPVDTLFKRADKLLYQAKDQGRDRVVSNDLVPCVATQQAS